MVSKNGFYITKCVTLQKLFKQCYTNPDNKALLAVFISDVSWPADLHSEECFSYFTELFQIISQLGFGSWQMTHFGIY